MLNSAADIFNLEKGNKNIRRTTVAKKHLWEYATVTKSNIVNSKLHVVLSFGYFSLAVRSKFWMEITNNGCIHWVFIIYQTPLQKYEFINLYGPYYWLHFTDEESRVQINSPAEYFSASKKRGCPGALVSELCP